MPELTAGVRTAQKEAPDFSEAPLDYLIVVFLAGPGNVGDLFVSVAQVQLEQVRPAIAVGADGLAPLADGQSRRLTLLALAIISLATATTTTAVVNGRRFYPGVEAVRMLTVDII